MILAIQSEFLNVTSLITSRLADGSTSGRFLIYQKDISMLFFFLQLMFMIASVEESNTLSARS